jgi:starch synthase
MSKKKILYVSQEISPYLASNILSDTARHLPQAINESGNEVRLFMPRFGSINERRNQLHEVIRLSGMNLIVNDIDQLLIIKVASVPQAKMQVYFIDNEEYFKRKFTTTDADGNAFPDNDERMIFFCRGVLETVKKLGWSPDIIHCHGWMASLLPLYLKENFKDDPIFKGAKVVYSAYNNAFEGELDPNFSNKLKFDGFSDEVAGIVNTPSYANLSKLALEYTDALVNNGGNIDPEIIAHAKSKGIPVYDSVEKEDYKEKYNEIYESVLVEQTV